MKYLSLFHHLKRLVIAGLLVFTTTPQSLAQSTDPLFDMRIHSPETASLGEYVERPVSYYTGTPQISIPIHTIKLKDFNFPISLSYHAGGVKVDEVASNIGMGWTLIAGGSIMKVAGNGSGFPGPSPVSYPDDYCNFNPNAGVGNGTDPDYVFALSVTDNNLKTEPDLFNYNFLGNSGKFVRDPLNTNDYYAIPLNNLDISFNNGSFSITDEKGIKYAFGAIEVTTHAEHPVSSSGGYSPSASYAFYLSQVTLPTGDHIDIEYESNSYAYVSSLRQEEYQPSGSNIGCSTPTHFNFPVKSISLVHGLRIKKIEAYGPLSGSSPFVYADFIYDQDSVRQDMTLPDDYPGAFTNEARALDSIKIYYPQDGSTNPSYVFNLKQVYTSSAGTGNSYGGSLGKRHWLTSFEEVGKSAYRFEYNHDNPLPNRLSYGQDYFGYYNGVISNTTTIPNTVTSTANGANRSIDYTYAQSGLLRRITYPTGGYTEFAFEGNEGGAGLRLLSQKSYDYDNVLERELYYEYAERSSRGLPRFHETVTIPNGPNENDEPQDDCIWHRNSSGAAPTLTGRYRSFTVGYGKVTEKNGPNGEQGETVYEFYHDYDINVIEPSIVYSGAPISYEWVQGLPKKTTYYANDNGTPKKVKEIKYTYEVTNGLANSCDTSTNLNLKQFDVYLIKASRPPQSTTGVYGATPAEFEVEQLKIITNWQYQSKVEEIDYPSDLNQINPLSRSTEYVYDADKKVILSTKMTDSQGQVRETRYKHPFHYSAQNPVEVIEGPENGDGTQGVDSTQIVYSPIEGIQVYKKMTFVNILNNPIETQVWVDNKLVESAIVEYADLNENFVPKYAYRSNFDTPLTSPTDHDANDTTLWNNLFEKRAAFEHDDYGRLVQQNKEGDVVTSYIWGYDKTVVVAEVQNVDYIQIESLLTKSVIDNLSTNLDSTQVAQLKAIPGARVTHYEYDPGYGVIKITDPNNKTVQLDYDTNGRLVRTLDNDQNVLQQYEYRYKSQD